MASADSCIMTWGAFVLSIVGLLGGMLEMRKQLIQFAPILLGYMSFAQNAGGGHPAGFTVAAPVDQYATIGSASPSETQRMAGEILVSVESSS